LTVRALLLAGGLGSRLRPLTERVPKCLVPIGSRVLLDHWVDALLEAEIYEAVVNTHHLAEQVRKAIQRVNTSTRLCLRESFEPVLLGSAGTMRDNRELSRGASSVVVVYTDNLSDLRLDELLRFHEAERAEITMALFHTPTPRACGIAVLDEAQVVRRFVEKPASPESDLANAGVYVFTPSSYEEVADANAFDLGAEVLPRFVGRMKGFVHRGYHRDIGTIDAWEQAQRDVAQGVVARTRGL
jgi:NDP-sugar pyrophosphorylase family protein